MLLNREKGLEVYHRPSQDHSATALLPSNKRDTSRGSKNRGMHRGVVNNGYNAGRGNG